MTFKSNPMALKRLIKLSLAAVLLSSIVMTGCQKHISDEVISINTFQIDHTLLRDSINTWFKEQQKKYPANFPFIDSIHNSIKWNEVSITQTSSDDYYAVYYPISYNSNSTGLVFMIDKNNLRIQSGYITEIRFQNDIHDSEKEIFAKLYNNKSPNFSGSVSAYSIINRFIIERGFKDGKGLYFKKPENSASATLTVKTNSEKNTGELPKKNNDCTLFFLVTYWDDGTTDREYIGSSCTGGGAGSCEQTRIISRNSQYTIGTNCNQSNPGGSTSELDLTNIIVYSGPKPITNISQYIQCFTSSGTNCKVTLYVDQPSPGTTTLMRGLGDVGHTFFTFTQTLTNGQEVTRNIGFYPGSSLGGNPIAPSCQGELNNDDNRSWNTGVEFAVSPDNFMKVLNYITGPASNTYNLNSNNCTSIALGALQSGGIFINTPTAYYSVAGITAFSGYSPAYLGETIRTMPLDDNMLRLHPPTDSSPKNSHPNTGSCQ